MTIGKPFAVGRFAVTREEFAEFVKACVADGGCYVWSGTEWKDDKMRLGARRASNRRDHPVVCVNWNDAKAYVSLAVEENRQGLPAAFGG